MKIAIIGGGWLGKPLALDLLKNHKDYFSELIVTNTTGVDDELRELGVKILKMDLEERANVSEAFLNVDALIYTIPPIELEFVENFFNQINKNTKIIFTSSISVYSKDMGDVSEDVLLDERTSSSPLLIRTERYIQNNFHFSTILRLGGLYGLKRHPIFFLTGKTGVKSGYEFLHLASLKDGVNAIITVLKKEKWGEVFNIVSDLRILKKEYYSLIAKKLGLVEVFFDENIKTSSKALKISNDKSKIILSMIYEDPIDFDIK